MERFVNSYKVKRIVLSNAVELELPMSVKIHPVVNISRVRKHQKQVKCQKKILLVLVVIEGNILQKWTAYLFVISKP